MHFAGRPLTHFLRRGDALLKQTVDVFIISYVAPPCAYCGSMMKNVHELSPAPLASADEAATALSRLALRPGHPQKSITSSTTQVSRNLSVERS